MSPADRTSTTTPAARIGLWALPLDGVLLGLSTLTHQPAVEDFDAYARYVTTPVFLASHLGASILGSALAILGAMSVTAVLGRGRAAGTAIVGLVMTTLSNVFLAAAFGSAAFVQPGIGRAHLPGVPGMPTLNGDTAYGPALFAAALAATSVFVVAAVVLGVAIARTSRRLRSYGARLCGASSSRRAVRVPSAGYAAVHRLRALAAATVGLALRLPAVMDDGTLAPGRSPAVAPA
ncbi:MAG: hypothetical protein ACLGIA_11085 [Actinomycetes bacterium]